jgi:hypothetical protein
MSHTAAKIPATVLFKGLQIKKLHPLLPHAIRMLIFETVICI